MQVRVVGVAFQSGSTHLPVGLWMQDGAGAYEQAFVGRYSDVDPETPVFDRIVEAGATVNFLARGGSTSGSWYGARDTRVADICITARVDGETIPEYTPAYDQADIESFLTQYINPDNTVSLGPQDIIYLFELGTRNTDSFAFDMQDIVVVVTVTEAP